MVLLQNVHLRILVISAHAPDSTKGKDIVEQFWSSLTKLIKKNADKEGAVIVGMDGNQQLSALHTAATGGIGASKPGAYADNVLHAVQQCGLYLPATFQ